jgi:hypothetical protein
MQETLTLTGDHESRLAQLLRVAQQEARSAQRTANPRMEDALIEVENVLADQLATLALATEDDAAEAEASGTAERERRAWRPMRAA